MKIITSKSKFSQSGSVRPGGQLQERQIDPTVQKIWRERNKYPNLYKFLSGVKAGLTDMINTMRQSIDSATSKGEFSLAVGSNPTQVEKDKFNAYMELASLFGRTIGPGKYNENAHTVTAPIS